MPRLRAGADDDLDAPNISSTDETWSLALNNTLARPWVEAWQGGQFPPSMAWIFPLWINLGAKDPWLSVVTQYQYNAFGGTALYPRGDFLSGFYLASDPQLVSRISASGSGDGSLVFAKYGSGSARARPCGGDPLTVRLDVMATPYDSHHPTTTGTPTWSMKDGAAGDCIRTKQRTGSAATFARVARGECALFSAPDFQGSAMAINGTELLGLPSWPIRSVRCSHGYSLNLGQGFSTDPPILVGTTRDYTSSHPGSQAMNVLPGKTIITQDAACQNCDLQFADLSGVDLSNVDLTGATLDHANLNST